MGTHTHVQSADEKILPAGTGYITDLGLTGATNSILGMRKDNIINKFRTQLPSHFEVATGQCQLSGAIVTIDQDTKSTNKITRIRKTD
jgi:calcineurin-like phosphoesterase